MISKLKSEIRNCTGRPPIRSKDGLDLIFRISDLSFEIGDFKRSTQRFLKFSRRSPKTKSLPRPLIKF